MPSARAVSLPVLVSLALALSAGPAFANQAIEVVNASTATHCSTPVVEGHQVMNATGCHVDVAGTHIDIVAHVAGIETTIRNDCSNSFELHLGENGQGYVTGSAWALTPEGDEGCNEIVPCDSEELNQTHPGTHGHGAQHVWPFEAEEIGSEELEAHAVVCIRTGVTSLPECEGELDFHIREVDPGDPLERLHVRAVENHTNPGLADASLPEGASGFTTRCEIQNAEWSTTYEEDELLNINHP